MRLALITPFPPYRGGISKESEILYNALIKKNHDVYIFNFSKLYPNIFFPGKNQYIDNYAEKKYENISRCINSVNPFSWNKVANMILEKKINNILIRYWHPFFIPAFSYIINKVKKYNPNVKIFSICDNLYPHEKFIANQFLLNLFLKKIDGFFCMSKQVSIQIEKIKSNAKIKNVFLPIKDYLKKGILKEEALKIINVEDSFIILFFGLIREYKGLDLLLYSLKEILINNKNIKLLIAGECYEDKNKYLDIIKKEELTNNVIWVDRYIDENEINIYFSAADVIALPYKNASQSGIIPIAYNYNKLVVSSNLPGLREYIVNRETGYLFEHNNFVDLSNLLLEISLSHDFDKSERAISNYKKNFSSSKLADEIISFIHDA